MRTVEPAEREPQQLSVKYHWSQLPTRRRIVLVASAGTSALLAPLAIHAAVTGEHAWAWILGDCRCVLGDGSGRVRAAG